VRPLPIEIGERYGYFTVIDGPFSSGRGQLWEVECDCGSLRRLPAGQLNRQLSCGCARPGSLDASLAQLAAADRVEEPCTDL
jgi:hypothetical protein